MWSAADQLPRIFQANIDRLYERVVRISLEQLPVHADVRIGGEASQEAFLDQLAKQVDNHTAQEARRAFALTLATTFERQLRLWCRSVLPEKERDGVSKRAILKLLDQVGAARGIDLASGAVRTTIEELILLGNVVRHGDGSSCEALRRCAPHLWTSATDEDATILRDVSALSELVRVGEDDLRRYARAVVRFWGLADLLPLAVVDAPY